MYWKIFMEKPIGQELLEILREGEVLDVGCGDGESTLILAAAGCKMTGIDPKLPEEIEANETGGNPRFEQISIEEFTKKRTWEGTLLFDHSLYTTPTMVETCKFHPKARIIAIQSAKRNPLEKHRIEFDRQGRKTRIKKALLFSMEAPERQPEGSGLAHMLIVCEFEKKGIGMLRLDYIAEVLFASRAE